MNIQVSGLLKPSSSFIEETEKYEYSKADMILPIIVWLISFVFVWLLCVYNKQIALTFNDSSVFIKILVSFAFPVTIIGLVFLVSRFRGQKIIISSFTNRFALRSLMVGLVFGSIHIVIIIVLRSLTQDYVITFISDMGFIRVLWTVAYHLVGVAFMEELLYRRFMAPRFLGFFRSKTIAVILGGFLFSLLHVPQDMFTFEIGFLQAVVNRALHDIIIHGAFLWLYAKYNNLLGPVLWHFIVNYMQLLLVMR